MPFLFLTIISEIIEFNLKIAYAIAVIDQIYSWNISFYKQKNSLG